MKVIVKSDTSSEEELYLIPIEKEKEFDEWQAKCREWDYWFEHWEDYEDYRFDYGYRLSRLVLDLVKLPEKRNE